MCYNGSLSFHTLWPCSLGWLFLCLLVQSPSIIDWLKQQPTPVFLAGKSHGRRSLVGYTVHGIAESDTTERLHSLTPVRHFEWSINKIFARTWEWTFSTPWDKMTMKCPSQNHGQVYDQEVALPTKTWHLPSTSTKIKSWPLQLLTFNTPEKSSGWKSGMRHSVLWEKLAEQAFR